MLKKLQKNTVGTVHQINRQVELLPTLDFFKLSSNMLVEIILGIKQIRIKF